MDRSDVFISVVVPAYNESDTIFEFYDRLVAVLSGLTDSWEIIFVNDGSTDNTKEKLTYLSEKDARVIPLSLSRNFGKEAATTAGLDYSSGDVVIPIDADLQDPPELIPDMLDFWESGFDVVYATRTSRAGETWLKKLTANLFYKALKRITNIDIPGNTGDFRLMDRTVVNSIGQLNEKNRFMKGIFAWVGFKQKSILYERDARIAGTSKWNYWKLWSLAIEGITSFSIVPLQAAGVVGFTISLLSFAYAVFIVLRTLLLGVEVPGYASVLVAVLFLGGVQLVSIGILGEYIGRIYNEVKDRPVYLLEKKRERKNG